MSSLSEQSIEKTKAFIEAKNLPITIEEIQSIIYDAKSHSSVFQQWMTLCDTA
jgi:DNA polymerase III delta prime subunit